MKRAKSVAALLALGSATTASADELSVRLAMTQTLSWSPISSRLVPIESSPVSLFEHATYASLQGDGGGDGGGAGSTPAPSTPATGQVNPLSNFNLKTSNNSSLVTGHIATAYAPAWRNRCGEASSKTRGANEDCTTVSDPRQLNFWNAIGVDISASLPAQSATVQDYGKQALLTLTGGVINIYGAFAGRTEDPKKPPPDDRVLAFDHIYPNDATAANEMEFYVKQGIGGRAVKTSLEGSGYGGVGTAYLGVGVDGPLLSSRSGGSDSNAGWTTLEVFATANAINSRTLNTIFKTTNAPSSVSSASARFVISLPGRFYMSVEYAKAFGSYGRSTLRDTSIFSFGYNTDTKQTVSSQTITDPNTQQTTTTTVTQPKK